ncbi:putative glycolipid-binding domain-containing protein [Parapedobacter deserti]|uniref:Glycolipid-binding domain-containing protein n=1 Tax=Parapedobacter deserti TaxID=1912957 RepID=A0ABV7JL56_9SPHI
MAKQYVWQGLYYRTMEYLSVEQLASGWWMHGKIVGETSGKPMNMRYNISTDADWVTQQVSVWVDGDPVVELTVPNKDFGECKDVDISMTPFTNTLTINRTKLTVGEVTENTVLYIDVENRLRKPVRQRYSRVDADWYRYENLESGFVSMIKTDADGIVIHYPGIFERVYPAS